MNIRLLHNKPIDRKLMLLVMSTSALALGLAAFAFLAYEWLLVGEQARHEAQVTIEILAGNLGNALETGDMASVTNILQSLKSQPQFHTSGYVTDGALVASLAGFTAASGPPKGLAEGVHSERDWVYVYRVVPSRANRVAVIYLQCEVQPLYGQFARSVLIVLLVCAGSLLLAVRLGGAMRRSLAQPIQNLWRATRLVSRGVQSPPAETAQGVDELAQLVEGFNGVMSQIQTREAALEKAHSDLEVRVAERTRELQQEIQQRRRAESALADEKERLAVTLRSIGDGVVATDRRGYIVLFNAIAEELTGWTSAEALGRPLREVLRLVNAKTRAPCDDPVEQVLRSDGPLELSENMLLLARNGTERLIGDSGAPIRDRQSKSIGVVLVFRDVTEKQRLADELLKASKLESIGLMAGGIAHDFNNILTAILGNVSLAKLHAPADSDLMGPLNTAEKAAIRARDVTRQLLAFAKGGAPVKKPSSLTEMIRDNTNFALQGSNVRCRLSLPDNLWPAEVDASQFTQAIQSLVLHGVRSMPGGGSLEVRAANVNLTEPTWVPLPPGNYVMISIQDHGQGIAPEALPKLFDPYFTKDGGSGLGLAAAYSIIKRHDGHLAVESKAGKGTAFHVYLPANAAPAETAQAAPAPVVCRHRILVMDDDPGIREVAREMLESLGYDVEVAGEGADAIERYRESRSAGRPFAAVILDLTVQGGMGGQDTIEELLRLDKEVKAIVSSGYYDDPVIARYREYGFSGAVPKPYNLEELERVLRELLPSSKGNGSHRERRT